MFTIIKSKNRFLFSYQLLIFILVISFAIFGKTKLFSQSQFTIVQWPLGGGKGVASSSIVYGDYDNDGDLDLAVTGGDVNYRFIIYRNDTGTFTNVQEPMGTNKGVSASSIAFGDYDNDGDLDLALTGYSAFGVPEFMIYRNDGGTFNLTQEPMGANNGVARSSIVCGDYDNDGDLDLAVTGDDGANNRFIIYRNDGGIFNLAQEPMGANLGVDWSSIAHGDYDNDGDLDIAVTGSDGANNRFIIYRNDGGTFSLAQEPMGANNGVTGSSIAYGDYDNDGDLDIAVTGGDGPNNRFIIYRNDGGTFNLAQEPMGVNNGVSLSSIAYGDYDNDGDLDIALTGYSGGGDTEFMIYRNEGGTFNLAEEPMAPGRGVGFSSIAYGDYDNDGDLDIALTGMNWASASRFIIFRNDESTTNILPTVPTGMSAFEDGGYWRLQWNRSSDDHTHTNVIRYQIAIGTNSGIYDYTSTNIDYPRGQANLGKVTVVTGKPFFQTQVSISKPIYWKVCAIDSAFKHSAYCNEQIGFPPPPSKPQWISAISVSTNQINLLWNDVSSETSYTLFRNIINNTNSVTNIEGLAANVTNYNDSALVRNTIYYYWIKAYNENGASIFSEVISNKTYPLPPEIPIVTAIEPVATNQIDLEWINVSNETSYTLFRSINNDTNAIIRRIGFSSNQTNYNDAGLSPNVIYYYWVKAYNGPSSSFYSTVASNITFPTPPQVIDIQTISTNQLNVTWNSIPNATSYTLFRSITNNPGIASNIAGFSGNQTNHNDTGLTPDTTYYYWIKTYNPSSGSIFSSVISNKTYPMPPVAPVIYSIQSVSTSQIDMEWSKVLNASSYTLFRGMVNNSGFASNIIGFLSNQTNHNDSGLSPNTVYYYWVKSYNWGPTSSPFSAGVSNITFPTPPQVINIQVISTNQIDIEWNKVLNATSYTLFRSLTNNLGSSSNIAGFQGNQTNHNDTGLSPETTYYYWIKTYNPSGESIFSLVTFAATFPKDKTPPVTTANIDSGMYVGEISVVLTAIDKESGVEKIYYTIDSSNPKTSSKVKSGLSPLTIKLVEPTTLKFYAKNNDGYFETVKTKTYEILKAPEEDVMVYNNYLDLTTGELARIVFGNSGKAEIKIYTFKGVLVKEYPEIIYNTGDIVEWDGCYMDTDNQVAAGVYIVVVTGDINKQLKIIVKN